MTELTPEELKAHLVEYRKASRAMMHLCDASNALRDILKSNLEYMGFQNIIKLDLNVFCFLQEKPKSVSKTSYDSVATLCDFALEGYYNSNTFKATKDSCYLYLQLCNDIYTKKEPQHSTSGLYCFLYVIDSVTKGPAIDWTQVKNPDFTVLAEQVDEYGLPIERNRFLDCPHESFKPHPKLSGRAALALFDLHLLVNEDAVEANVIRPIKDKLTEWGI